jgi:ribosome biogenesis GTPase A
MMAKNNNIDNSLKMNINWFPGHMAKTRKQIAEDFKLIDVVVEILDARIPSSSQNPEIKQLLKNQKKIIALNKSDLSDERDNKQWVNKFKQDGNTAILIDANTGKGIEEVITQIQKVMEDDLKKMAEKGRIGRKIRVMVVGIPNVGKSSFINRIAKKNSAEVGNKPGVTKRKQWIRINDLVELLDTPGVLWPKFESEKVALNLAFTGTIKDDILEITEVAYHLTKFLLENYRENFAQRYSLSQEIIEQMLSQNRDENQNIYEIMQLVGRKRCAIISGGNIDDERTSKIILDDFRCGKFGKITLEKVN